VRFINRELAPAASESAYTRDGGSIVNDAEASKFSDATAVFRDGITAIRQWNLIY